VPAGPQWVHEIKHDGYRLLVRKSSGKERFPVIVDAVRKIKAASFYIDGEGVVCDAAGVALFD
jgi:ATP-dependent DNA ligase